MKNLLFVLCLSLLNAGILFVLLHYGFLSYPYSFLVVGSTLFFSGFASNKLLKNPPLIIVLLTTPIAIASLVFIIKEIHFWVCIPYYIVMVYLGILTTRKPLVFLVSLFTSLLFSFFTVPELIFKTITIDVQNKSNDFTFEDLLSHRDVTPTDLNGKIIVLSYITSWCGVCVQELPTLKKIQKLFPTNVKVALVCPGASDTREKILSFYKRRNLTFELWYDEDSHEFNKYKFTGFPTLAVIDQNGETVHIHTGYMDDIQIDKRLEKIIKKLIKN